MRRLPPLKTLPVFIAVAKHLSFSRAAEELSVTHSAVSQSIKLLEDFLQMKLFQRNAKQISLTEQGKLYYRQISSALDSIDDATQQLKTRTRKQITVNVIATLAMHWLIARMPSFQRQYPEMDLRIAALGKEIDFKIDHVDCAITSGLETQWPNLEKELLFQDELVLVAHPSLKASTSLEKILKTQKAIYVNQKSRKEDWSLWCKHMGVRVPEKSNRIIMQSSSLALQAVLGGLGICVTHKPFVADALKAGHLQLLSKDSIKLATAYYLIYPKESASNPNLKSFRNWLKSIVEVSQTQ